MIYYTRDGARLEADNHFGIVIKLRQMSRGLEDLDVTRFMAELADRTKTQTGASIRICTTSAFITDLVKASLLIEKD